MKQWKGFIALDVGPWPVDGLDEVPLIVVPLVAEVEYQELAVLVEVQLLRVDGHHAELR